MTLPQKAADAITSAAGWQPVRPDDDGVFHFRLEKNIEMDFFSPDGRVGIFCSTLAILPDAEVEAEELLKICTQRAVAVCRKRKSILSLDANHLQLHRCTRLNDLSSDMAQRILPTEAKDFLNDLVWWKAQVDAQGTRAAAPSPFSMPGFGGSWLQGR